MTLQHAPCAAATTGGDQDAEPGARLTCHLLLRLFSTADRGGGSTSGGGADGKSGGGVKSSTDRHLLTAAHQSITVGAVVAVLKSILMLGEWPRLASAASAALRH